MGVPPGTFVVSLQFETSSNSPAIFTLLQLQLFNKLPSLKYSLPFHWPSPSSQDGKLPPLLRSEKQLSKSSAYQIYFCCCSLVVICNKRKIKVKHCHTSIFIHGDWLYQTHKFWEKDEIDMKRKPVIWRPVRLFSPSFSRMFRPFLAMYDL